MAMLIAKLRPLHLFIAVLVLLPHLNTLQASQASVKVPTAPSLQQLRTALPSIDHPEPLVVDTVLHAEDAPKEGRLTLLRERNGWCPYSERVWLALEFKGLDYDTFLIDNMGNGRPKWYGYGSTPQVRWESGRQQGESMDIIYKLDEEYAGKGNGKLIMGPAGRVHVLC